MPNGGHYPAYKCDNCGRVYDPDEDLGDKITEKNWHFEPGTTVPYGICDCGGYIYRIPSQSDFVTDALNALVSLFTEEQKEELKATGFVTLRIHPGLPKRSC